MVLRAIVSGSGPIGDWLVGIDDGGLGGGSCGWRGCGGGWGSSGGGGGWDVPKHKPFRCVLRVYIRLFKCNGMHGVQKFRSLTIFNE